VNSLASPAKRQCYSFLAVFSPRLFRGVVNFIKSKRNLYETFAIAGSITLALRVSCLRQPLMSVGYFNGGGDVTAGPGGDINKLDVRQITHLNYSFGLVYNDEKDETNAALKDPAKLHQIWLSPKVASDLALIPALRKQNPNLKVLLSVGGWGRVVSLAQRPQRDSRGVYPLCAGDC
jgi:hypothetical protein